MKKQIKQSAPDAAPEKESSKENWPIGPLANPPLEDNNEQADNPETEEEKPTNTKNSNGGFSEWSSTWP